MNQSKPYFSKLHGSRRQPVKMTKDYYSAIWNDFNCGLGRSASILIAFG
ncbi:hypothetical protein [Oscillatoria sp. HE19RPO]|nr:hypothetical protein [Oscillatoria sp. HE19RPO]